MAVPTYPDVRRGLVPARPAPRVTVTVRDAELRDLDVLVRNCLGVARESEGLEPDGDTVRAAVRAALEDPHKARYIVAEADGVVVGNLYLTFEWSDWTNGWYWWIQAVYVDPEWRGRGVYDRLHAAVHERARAAGDVRSVRLYVDADNERAVRTYERLGMKRTHYLLYDQPVT